MTGDLPTMRLPNGLTVTYVDEGETAMLYRDIFLDRCYLQHGIGLEPSGIVFDLGAHIGMSTLFFHTTCPGLRFYVFEPSPAPFAALTANIESHGIDAHATNCGMAGKSGTGRFTYYPRATVMSGFHADPAVEEALTRSFLLGSGVDEADVGFILRGKYEPVVLDVPLCTLSEVIRAHDVPRIDLLKLDVEKSELDVLSGLDEADWPKLGQLVAEVHDRDRALASMTAMLDAHGLAVTVVQDPLLVGTDVYEVFAVRPGRRRS